MLLTNTFFGLVLYHMVACDLETNIVKIPANKTYRYIGNHPPGFEGYDGVSFEEEEIQTENIRIEKSVDEKIDSTLEYSDNNKNIDLTTIQPVIEGNTDNLETTAIISPSATIVSVPELRNKKKLKRRRNRNQLRQNSIKERKVNIDSKDNNSKILINTNSTTNANNNSSITRTKLPQTFPKRPVEFNPVFKKNSRIREPLVKIVTEKNYVFSHNGNFHYSYEGGDGTKISSQGELKSFNDDKIGEAVVGSVYYKDRDGNDFSLSYTADENGYRPQGAHLPTPPPIPPEIARALEYLATKQPVTESYDEKK